MRRAQALAILALLLPASTALVSPSPPPAPESRPAFLGETLRFSMAIFGVNAGDMVLSAREDSLQGRPVWRGEIQAISNGFFSKIFVVRDWIATWMEPGSMRSLRFEKHTVEGRRVRDETVVFDWEAGIARGELNGSPWEVPLGEPPVFDTLSTVFSVRAMKLDLAAPVREMRVVNRRGVATIRVVIQGRETVKVPAGTFRTLRVEPSADPDSEGLIGKGKNLVLWLTDDERKMPVKLRSKLKTGTLEGRLKSVERSDAPPRPAAAAPTPAATPEPAVEPSGGLRL